MRRFEQAGGLRRKAKERTSIRTSVDLPLEVRKAASKRAAQDVTTLRGVILAALAAYLGKGGRS
jgi:hypothetical protein